MSNELKIDPDKYYTAKSIVDSNLVHWKSRMTFVKKLREDKWNKLFNPIMEKAGDTIRFYIKGENIIKYKEYIKNENKN
tara:strand:- start:50 stop:286 length:237 start_codon:yes stop_codon:yes gene_type:complete